MTCAGEDGLLGFIESVGLVAHVAPSIEGSHAGEARKLYAPPVGGAFRNATSG